MDTQAIRKKILDLALRGKLTEQLQEDGTAEDYYNQIQQKKGIYRQTYGKKESNSSQSITIDEVPFDVPKSWKWVRLSELCIVINGDRGKNYPAKSTLQKHGIPFISAQNLDGKTVINDDNLFCLTSEQYNKLGNGKLQVNDIVICIRGSLGKHGRYPYEQGAIASSLVICRLYWDIQPLSDYLMLWLDSALFYEEIEKYNNGSAQPNLAANNLEKFLIPLPPISEQKRIIDIINSVYTKLDTIDTLQSQYQDNLATLKSKIIDAGIQGKLTEQLPEDGTAEELYQQIQQEKKKLIQTGIIKKEKPYSTSPVFLHFPFEIPENWKFVRLGDLMINRDSERIPVSVADRRKRGKVYDYYGASGVIDKIDDYLFDKDLLLLGEDGANLLARSTPIAFIASGKYWVNNHAHVLDACSGIELKYVCHYINAISLTKYVTGSAQPKMNQENMNAIWIALPPLAEQKRIVAKLEELLQFCED